MHTTAPPAVPRSPRSSTRVDGLAPLAKTPVLLIAALLGSALLLTSGRYGYFADELYFLAAGDHLSWGYADQPPALPLLARLAETLAPDSVVVLRIPAMLAAVATVFTTALIARELGGDRRAQTLAAGACATANQFITAGHFLLTWSIDPVMWTLVSWLLVRWVRLHDRGEDDDRLLLWAGVVTAVAMQVKLLIPAFWLMAGIAVLFVGPRRLLSRPKLWWGAAVAVLSVVPTALWQANNGWPQLRMAHVVSSETFNLWVFLRSATDGAGFVGAVLVCFGLWRLLRSRELRPYRFLGWTTVALTALFALSGGRSYYVAGFYGLLFAVATVELQRRREKRGNSRWGWIAYPAYAVSACLAVSALPPTPAAAVASSNVLGRGSLGWQRLTSQVAKIHRNLPPGQRRNTAVITHDYWSAAAIHHYGPELGIPRVHSGSRGFGYFGHPREGTDQVLYLAGNRQYLERFFHDVTLAGKIHTRLPTYYGGKPIWLAEDPKQPWDRLWPRMSYMSLWGP